MLAKLGEVTGAASMRAASRTAVEKMRESMIMVEDCREEGCKVQKAGFYSCCTCPLFGRSMLLYCESVCRTCHSGKSNVVFHNTNGCTCSD